MELNEPGGITLAQPGFLQARAIDSSQVQARVSATVDGVEQTVVELPVPDGETGWRGEIVVPEGSDVVLEIDWIEAGVQGLPDELAGELLLATHELRIDGVDQNQSIGVDVGDYVTESTDEDPRPELDLDEDGFGNLQERQQGSSPTDASQVPAEVLILYSSNAPSIDGRYDSLWNTAQFRDVAREDLLIDKVQIDRNVVQPGEDRRYRWAGMHDGEYLYLLVFAEASGEQTPFADSVDVYEDDAVDIFWDGNNSKGTAYDGVDDFHLLIGLLSLDGDGSANRSSGSGARLEFGDQSAPLDVSAIDYAICLCSATGEQQLYEIRLNLEQARISVDTLFGLDIQLNNDVDGGQRDAKWAWNNDTGVDDTWRFPIRMGTARLEAIPE